MQLKWFSALVYLVGLSQLRAAVAEDQKVLENEHGAFDAIRDSLKKASIIEDVVDDFRPSCYVAPFYKHKPVALGNSFKPSMTKDIPAMRIVCPYINETAGLTLVLTDPDAPSREDPKWSEMCHWIVVIPTDSKDKSSINVTLSVDDPPQLVEYKPPGPPPKTGSHRYIFLLLEGDNSNLTAPEDRKHWGTGKKGHGVKDWAKKEGLEVVGANFFYEKNKKQ